MTNPQALFDKLYTRAKTSGRTKELIRILQMLIAMPTHPAIGDPVWESAFQWLEQYFIKKEREKPSPYPLLPKPPMHNTSFKKLENIDLIFTQISSFIDSIQAISTLSTWESVQKFDPSEAINFAQLHKVLEQSALRDAALGSGVGVTLISEEKRFDCFRNYFELVYVIVIIDFYFFLFL